MYVATVDIGAEGLEVDRFLDPAALRAREKGQSLELEPVHLTGWVGRLGYGLEFRGRLETAVQLACGRCLEPYRLEVSLPFDLIYKEPAGTKRHAGEDRFGELPESEDPAVAVLDKGRIDLGQLALEQLYLALPLKPLCRADCRGLCSECGAWQDEGDCGCSIGTVDPRWAALETLKKKL